MATRGHSEGITMSGGGLYSLATIGAKHVIDAATPLVLEAIAELPTAALASGFTLSDMGTADAGTSLSMVTEVIDAVRARAPQAPITVVYSDQPRNDFNALIANVYGLGAYDSYLERNDETRVAWREALGRGGPVVLALSRQGLTVLDRSRHGPAEGLAHGGYVLRDPPGPVRVILIGGCGCASRCPPGAGMTVARSQPESSKPGSCHPSISRRAS